jgi:hypothetical protein
VADPADTAGLSAVFPELPRDPHLSENSTPIAARWMGKGVRGTGAPLAPDLRALVRTACM